MQSHCTIHLLIIFSGLIKWVIGSRVELSQSPRSDNFFVRNTLVCGSWANLEQLCIPLLNLTKDDDDESDDNENESDDDIK